MHPTPDDRPLHPTPLAMTRPSTLVSLQTLERVARPLVARLFAPHAQLFAAHGIALDALAATEQNDRALVRRVHAALHPSESSTAPAPSDDLAALAIALGDLATTKGRDAILALDVPANGAPPRFPRGTLSNEDLAATALLDAPELARDALAECSGAGEADEPRGVTELDPKDARPFTPDEGFRARLKDLFSERMHERDRTRYFDYHERQTAAIHMEIVHGKPPQARDFVRGQGAADGAAALALAQSTDVVTERARARICKTTGRLSLKANHSAIKEVLRRTLGEAHAGDPDHWRADGTCSLEAFSDFESALRADDVPGLVKVELHAFAVLTPWGETMQCARPRQDLVETPAKPAHAMMLSLGKVVQVNLLLRLESGAKAQVKITAKPKANVVDYPRGDAEIERVVREYLIARGVLRFGEAREREVRESGAPAAALDETA